MRDGIYKNLPMPRPWKSLLRCCDREAERGETARRMAERAVESDAHQELTPKFMRALVKAIEAINNALPGLSILPDYQASRDIGGQNNALENNVLAKAQRLALDGVRGDDLIMRATEGALAERISAQWRALEQHCLVHEHEAARPALHAVRGSLDSVDLHRIAKGVITGERKPSIRLRKRIDVDRDDLTQPQ